MALDPLLKAFRNTRLRLPQPWSLRFGRLVYLPRLARGHAATRMAFAEEALIEQTVAANAPLDHLGPGLSERVIEVPWVLRALPQGQATRVLDVGTAFAPIVYKRLLVRLPQHVEIADLAPAEVGGLPSHVADARRLPFEQDEFDAATCISTLEHIGMDNARYDVAGGDGGDVEALRELGRVARRVLVTVPAGADETLDWLRQYSPDTFRRRAQQAGLAVTRLEVFAHDADTGWSATDETSVADCHFGRVTYASAAVICAELRRAD